MSRPPLFFARAAPAARAASVRRPRAALGERRKDDAQGKPGPSGGPGAQGGTPGDAPARPPREGRATFCCVTCYTTKC